MITIELDAVEAMANAMSSTGYEPAFGEIIGALRKLENAGWQLTRKDQIIDDVVIAAQPAMPLPAGVSGYITWLPPGIVNLFSIVESLLDGTTRAKVILGILELKSAMKEGHPIVSAHRPEEALRIWADPDNVLQTMKFDGIEFNYHADPRPF